MTLETTIKNLVKYQNWRIGILDDWSKKDRVPPGEKLSEIITSALYYLKQYKETLSCQPNAASNILEVWSPTTGKESSKRYSPSKRKPGSKWAMTSSFTSLLS